MNITIEIDHDKIYGNHYGARMINAILRMNKRKAAADLRQFALEE